MSQPKEYSIWLSAKPYNFHTMYHTITERDNAVAYRPIHLNETVYVNTTKYKCTAEASGGTPPTFEILGNSIDTYPATYNNVGYSLTDSDFMHVGVVGSLSQSLPYSVSTTGILTQSPDTAIAVDSTSGSINTITVSATRMNIPDNTSTTPLPVTTSDNGNMKYYGYDYSTGTITQSDYRYIDNYDFIQKLIQLKTMGQMFYPALILRVYNMDSGSSTTPHDMYVYLDSFSCEVNLEDPSTMSISLTFIQRGKDMTGTLSG